MLLHILERTYQYQSYPSDLSRISKAVQDNNGYCPCMLNKSADTKCPCKVFREQSVEGECHCGRYVKVETNDE